jgi:hypothetical protein
VVLPAPSGPSMMMLTSSYASLSSGRPSTYSYLDNAHCSCDASAGVGKCIHLT